MKNKTKLRKLLAKSGHSQNSGETMEAALARINAEIMADNIREMDAMADELGIIRCSGYINQERQKDKEAGLCTCNSIQRDDA